MRRPAPTPPTQPYAQVSYTFFFSVCRAGATDATSVYWDSNASDRAEAASAPRAGA